MKSKMRRKTKVLIVGEDITSAQLALRSIDKGVGKVWPMMRESLKVKHFDLRLDSISKFKE